MFKMTKVGLAAAIVAGGFGLSSGAVFAQAGSDRVEITGSRIKRIETEAALPVVVIKAEDLDRAGVKTAEAAVQFIAQNQSTVNSSRSIGTTNGGAAYADLRALGVERTLVLLNGQRVVKNPYDGIATDLNVIPTVAIERIEVLTDGASSIYGSDAIAGVINIITRNDFQGVEIGASAKLPQNDGGEQYNANITGGFGSLAKDGFNVFGGFSYTKENKIASVERDFAKTGIILDRGLVRTSGTSFPGNYSQSATGTSTNPTLPGCAPPASVLIPEVFGPNSCRYDFTSSIDIMSEVERWSVFGRGTMALGTDHTASLEYFRAYNAVSNGVAPTPLTGLSMTPNSPYYPGNGITPITNTRLDTTRPISVGWRMVPAGQRASEIENTTQRLLGEVKGALGEAWSYNVAAYYSDSQVKNNFTGGYVSRQRIIDGLQGNNNAPFLNPFGDQTAAGLDYILGSKVIGQVQDITGKQYGATATVSGDLFKMPAGAVGFATGVEYRKEEIDYKNNFALIRQAASSGLELAEDTSGDITNYAIFAEANFPLLKNAPYAKSLEIPVSLRYDNNDGGSNTTPKIGVRWQTSDSLLIRGSYNKGFRAPGVFDLFAPNSVTFTATSYNDPVLCPNGTPVAGADPARDCGQQFRQLQGGNKETNPEESTAWTMGFIFDVAPDISFGVDYFNYKVEGIIGALPETAIFGDTARYADKFVRCSALSAADQAAIDACVPGTVDPLAYIVTTTTNLGNIRTEGFDFTVNARARTAGYGDFSFALTSTYLTKWEQQLVAGGEYYSALGRYSYELDFPAPRYQQVIRLGWNLGPWSVLGFHRYKSGYTDQNDADALLDASFANNKVGSWSVFDLSASYTGFKGWTLTAGVMNLFDKDPPFSNQGSTFQVAYDPRITDPVGRAFFLQGSYKF
jgi:iron complex outermembrane receptor protein